jgi:hypothetical protein
LQRLIFPRDDFFPIFFGGIGRVAHHNFIVGRTIVRIDQKFVADICNDIVTELSHFGNDGLEFFGAAFTVAIV